MHADRKLRTTTNLREDVSSFGASIEPTSLFLLRQVDKAVDSCKAARDMYLALATVCDVLAARARDKKFEGELDAEGEVLATYDRSLDVFSRINEGIKESIRKASSDRELVGEKRREVLEGYRSAREAVIQLFECMNDLKTAIMEHDADLSEVAGSFESVDELMVAIAKK